MAQICDKHTCPQCELLTALAKLTEILADKLDAIEAQAASTRSELESVSRELSDIRLQR